MNPTDICWSYSRNGWCRFGNTCRFRHDNMRWFYPQPTYFYNYRAFGNSGHEHPRPQRPQGYQRPMWRRRPKPQPQQSEAHQEVEDTLCHQVDNLEIATLPPDVGNLDQDGNIKQDDQNAAKVTEGSPVPEAKEDLMKMSRETEVTQLKKRFPGCKVLDSDPESSFIVQVFATDPDWPFSVNNVYLKVEIPVGYPAEVLCVTAPDEENPTFPPALTRHLNVSIGNWILDKFNSNVSSDKAELVFRPFLRWFDRNLVDLFTDGLRKTKLDLNASSVGLEFVPFEQLLPAKPNCDASADQENEELQREPSCDTANNEDEQENVESADTGVKRNAGTSYANVPRGTEMKFRLFEIGENVGTMKCQVLAMTVQCCKCKSRHDITASPKKVNTVKCTTCSQQLKLVFRPSIMHQFSAVVGYLDLEVCRPFDLILVNCSFLVDCIVCNKQMTVDGVHYGQIRTHWCHFCNAKMTFKIEGTKFSTHRQSTAIAGKEHVIRLEKITKVKDPAIQEGKPLPDNGACKHYKKSFRWFRFPCCGKAYPCDLCHDEKETGHEMKFANRIICGFCAYEQPYATDKQCVRCGTGMIKRSGSHWEGGKGCREKAKMSKDDKHKYVGNNKTIPKKIVR